MYFCIKLGFTEIPVKFLRPLFNEPTADTGNAQHHREIQKMQKKLHRVNTKIDRINRHLQRQSRLLDQEREICSAFVIFNDKSARDYVMKQ
jgi:hypothetical protein